MFADHKYEQMSIVRSKLALLVTPIQWVVTVPGQVYNWGATISLSHAEMRDEIATLRARSLVMERKVQQVVSLSAENTRLRELLNASARIQAKVLAAEIIGVDPDPFSHQVIINKGTKDGIYVGQPVLDAHGLMGQVIEANLLYCRVLLVADGNHAIPVQVSRNGVRAIAIGSGNLDKLQLVYVPDTADIQVGDLLESSGLGQRFPTGYPVGVVVSVEHDPGQQFAIVTAKPSAQLDRSRHVLMVFNQPSEEDEPTVDDEASELESSSPEAF